MNLTLTELPENVIFSCPTEEKVHSWWEKLKYCDKLFTDETLYDEVFFFKKLFNRNCYILEVEDNGIIVFDNIVEGLKGEVHVSFWDYKLSKRRDLLKECLSWALLRFNLYRVEAYVPQYARAVRHFLDKKMHFVFEGRLRKTLWYKGQLTDVLIYSILREEVLAC